MPLYPTPGAGTGDMLASNNLSEVASQSEAQENLGLPALLRPEYTRRLYNKAARIYAGDAVHLAWLVGGDSMAWRTPKFILPILRRLLGDAGFVSIPGASVNQSISGLTGGDFTLYNGSGGNAYDFTQSPTGQFAKIGSGTGWVGFHPRGQDANDYPFSPAINTDTSNNFTANRIVLKYTPTGTGVVKLQYQATNGGAWSDITGGSINVSGTSPAVATVDFTALSLWTYRVIHVSGAAVNVFQLGCYNTAIGGVVTIDFARGGLEMTDLLASPATATFIAADAPDVVSIEVKDSPGTYAAMLTSWAALFPDSDHIFLGTPEDSSDVSDPHTAEYNATMQATARTVGALYHDGLAVGGSYTLANALGEMEDGTHYNDKLGVKLAASLMWQMRATSWPFWKEVRGINSTRGSIDTLNTVVTALRASQTAAFSLVLQSTQALAADRTLTFDTGGASRAITLGGDLTLNGNNSVSAWTVTGNQQISGGLGIGGAGQSFYGLYIQHSALTPAGSTAFGAQIAPTYTAAANGNLFRGINLAGTIATGVRTGLTYTGLYIQNPAVSGTGTIDTHYQIYVEAPTRGTTNVAIGTAGAYLSGAPSGGSAKAFKIGEAATVSPTAPNRTLRVEIDGTVYFLAAKTTND